MKRVTTYRVPFYNRLFRFIFRPIFRFLFRLLAKVEIEGLENIPKDGAYIIAINHPSLFEPPFVLAFWPIAAEGIGAADIWDRPGQSLLVRFYGGIPVMRGIYDRRVIELAIAALKSGRPLMIAPEGGRTHQPAMRRGLPGVAYFIDQTDVPVVPVGIYGTYDDFLRDALKGKRPRIGMKIGKPLRLPPIRGKGEERRKMRQENADTIMVHLAALLPPEYHGYYANHPKLLALLNEHTQS